MKIAKINDEPRQQENFRSVKIRKSVITNARRTLPKDILEIRKNIPENKDVKLNKYFGQIEDPNYQPTDADAIFAGALVAAGIGLALL